MKHSVQHSTLWQLLCCLLWLILISCRFIIYFLNFVVAACSVLLSLKLCISFQLHWDCWCCWRREFLHICQWKLLGSQRCCHFLWQSLVTILDIFGITFLITPKCLTVFPLVLTGVLLDIQSCLARQRGGLPTQTFSNSQTTPWSPATHSQHLHLTALHASLLITGHLEKQTASCN